MNFYEDLIKKHGNTFLYGSGPLIRIVVNEPDLLADVLSRNNAQNDIKASISNRSFAPVIGSHKLFIANVDEHEHTRRMINPAFYHSNFKSMISIMTDQIAKTIESIFREFNEKQVDLQVLFKYSYIIHYCLKCIWYRSGNQCQCER